MTAPAAGFVPQMPGTGPGMDPNQMFASASMLYQQLGYLNGSPTEVDIISDLIRADKPLADFLTHKLGLPMVVQLFSTILDYKLVSFFKDFTLGIVQDESGNMFIQPALEQQTERGKTLSTMTSAEVQAEMTRISETLKAEMLGESQRIIGLHKQAASMKAQSSGLSNMLDEATGSNSGSGGGLAKLVNFGLRTAGVPVPPTQGGNPPPPPGR